jgi:acetolactate synthase-1/2/3 large subunit
MQIVAKEADVVCVVGARLKQRLGYGLPPRFAPQAKFIQIDVEAEELSRNRRIDVPIAADAGLAAAQLLAAVQAHRSATDASPTGWGTADAEINDEALQQRGLWVREALQERLSYLDALAAEPLPNDAIHPLTLGRIIAEVVPEDSVFVGDGADIQNWMYGALRIREAPGFLDHYPMGAMGVGTPLAVGAAAAARELAVPGAKCRTVILTTGDGSFGFYPAELHAAARAGLKLICVVGNDGAWGTELHGQLKALGRSVNTELGFLRYDKVGEGFGCRGEHVEQLAQLRPALERALAHDGPTVINVLIDREAGATLKTDPRVQMILFDDLASNLKTQHSFAG